MGFEPTASLCLKQRGLPVAYRAIYFAIADLRIDLLRFNQNQSPIENRKSTIEVIPDGLEPSFSGCKPGVVATGPRDQDRL